MRVRKIILETKILTSDSKWKNDDMAPRFSCIFDKTKPMRGGWKWRSVTAKSEKGEYVFLTQCNPGKDEWKAWLIYKKENSRGSLVARLEYHGSHPGVHIHTDCDRSGLEEGASGLNRLARIPSPGRPHRRISAWREDSFWEQARRYFRIEFPKGSLL